MRSGFALRILARRWPSQQPYASLVYPKFSEFILSATQVAR